MSRWLVGRATADDFNEPRRHEMSEWLRSLGVDPNVIALRAVVTQDGDRFNLHLSEHLLDERGRKFLDVAADAVAQRPLVVEVPADSWPTWLTGLNTPRVVGEQPHPVTVEIRSSGSELEATLVKTLRDAVRRRGGLGL